MKSDFSILLARHPPVLGGDGLCYGRKEMPLAPGWESFVSRWAGEGRIYASPSSRCRMTAERMAGSEGIQTDERLLEMDFGSWEGQKWSDISRQALDDWAEELFDYRPGGGEAVGELVRRVTAFWEHVLQQGESCRVVTHGGPLRVLQALADNRPFRAEDPAPPQGTATLLHFSNKKRSFVAPEIGLR